MKYLGKGKYKIKNYVINWFNKSCSCKSHKVCKHLIQAGEHIKNNIQSQTSHKILYDEMKILREDSTNRILYGK